MSVRRIAVLCAAVLAATTGSASAAVTLQPGAVSATDVGRCTLNFVFTDGTDRYFGSAAHCVAGVGQDVADQDGAVFGDVAMIGKADVTWEDWALIKIRPDALGRVDPRMKGSPQWPVGVATASEMRFGDLLQLSGFGLGFELTKLTQERRVGVLVHADGQLYRAVAPLIFGDSGGPLVQQRTGKALGIVSRLCIGICTDEGPTVEGMLDKARARGVSLRLVTEPATTTAAAPKPSLLKSLLG